MFCDFTLIVPGRTELTVALCDGPLYAGELDDGTVSCTAVWCHIDFSREAGSRRETRRSAVPDMAEEPSGLLRPPARTDRQAEGSGPKRAASVGFVASYSSVST